ncbi:selenocysteine-specific translation elongation factor [Pseudomonadota bacterium]
MIIATAGHIDHGKTALVKVLTGVDTDRLPEEKSRGLTIDIGFAYHSLKDGPVIGFVDVPGHERFVRNMLAGVGGIDFALLVIAADDGPMPQTLEHLAILDLLGVSQGAIALTKTDKVDAARVEQVRSASENVLAGTSLQDVPFYEVSAIENKGVDELREHLESVAREHQLRSSEGYFRLAVDRSFSVAGAGVVVTGTAFAGSVNTGDRLVLSPSGTQIRVRSIHAQNQDNNVGVAGQRLGINISGSGLNAESVHRGEWLLSKNIHRPTRRIDVRLRLLPGETKNFRHWSAVHVHLGAAEVTARIALLEDTVLSPGGNSLGQLVLDDEVGALYGDRFILRDHSAQRTIGV